MDKDKTSRIGQDFTLWSLIAFAMPGLLTNLSTRLFETLDDALFVSRFVGQNALAGIKILAPIDGVMFALTHIFGLGASTYAATEMGRGHRDNANRIFTKMIIMAMIVGGIIADVAPSFGSEVGRLCLNCGSDKIQLWDMHTCPKCRGTMSFTGEKEFWT